MLECAGKARLASEGCSEQGHSNQDLKFEKQPDHSGSGSRVGGQNIPGRGKSKSKC